jgi:cytoskeletal protein CcmA (bactofilin family)
MCDDGDPFTAGDACDGMGNCAGEKYIRDYSILRWPPNSPPDVKAFLRGKVQVGGIVCADFIGLRPYGVIDGDAVVPRDITVNPGMKFSNKSQVTGGLFTEGAPISGLGNVTVGGIVDTSGGTPLAPPIQRCIAASGQAQGRWTDFQARPADKSVGPVLIPPHSSDSITMPVGKAVAVIDIGDLRMKPYSTLSLVPDAATQQVIVRVRGLKGMRVSGRSEIALQGGLQPEQVIFLIDQRVRIGAFVEVSGTIFANERVFVAGHGVVNGQVLSTKRITINPSAMLTRHPFFGW